MGPQGQQGGQPPQGAFIMHPYYGMVPQTFPQPFGVYTGPPGPGEAGRGRIAVCWLRRRRPAPRRWPDTGVWS